MRYNITLKIIWRIYYRRKNNSRICNVICL